MRRLLRRIGNRLRPARPQPLILMYHRVAAPAVDPWGLAVHQDRFAAHMEVLRKHRTPLAMSEIVRRLQNGTLPGNAVAVTFDDGYVDNVSDARPRLAAAGVPATIFLVADALGQPREFWWDEVARGILSRREALDCEIPVNGSPCRLTFPAARDSEDDSQANASWRAWQQPSTARQRTFLDFWRRLRDARASARDEAMRPIPGGRESAGRGSQGPADGPWRCRAARTRWPVRDRRAYAHAFAVASARARRAVARDRRRQATLRSSWRAVKCAGLHTRTEL